MLQPAVAAAAVAAAAAAAAVAAVPATFLAAKRREKFARNYLGNWGLISVT